MPALAAKLPAESRKILDIIPALTGKTFPIPGRFRAALPLQVAELSRLLTGGRGDRSLSYLSRPNFLSAYLHYFLPWNLYRLCILLPNLDIKLGAGDTITDLGSGPLTFASALWIARPDLRKLPLEINCIDRCAPALEAGKKFFNAVCSASCNRCTATKVSSAANSDDVPWKINLLREDIDIRKPALRTCSEASSSKKQAALVCAVNIFNEIYENIPHSNTDKLKIAASNAARLMHNQALQDASILTVEPGVPQSGRFISSLRGEFLKLNRPPVSPCPHTEDCPLQKKPDNKKRWCHFACKAAETPKELHRLSEAAGLPKERLVFSYLLTGHKPAYRQVPLSAAKLPAETEVRIISDAFPLPDRLFGRYGCSAQGLVLLSGERNHIEKINSGSLITSVIAKNGQRDVKSGAIIIEYPEVK